jgi:FkbM family methyltransferase
MSADERLALAARLVELRAAVAAAREARDHILGRMAAAVVVRADFEDAEAAAEQTPQQALRRLQRRLLERTMETMAVQDHLAKLQARIQADIAAQSDAAQCKTMLLGSYVQGWAVSEALIAVSPASVEILSVGVGKELSFDLDVITAFTAAQREVRVHLVEPDPRSVEWVQRQRLTKRLVLHEAALADADGPLPFYQLARRTGSSLSNELSKTRDEDVRISVAGKTIATLRREIGLGAAALAKVDVEGYEHALLPQLTPATLNTTHLLLDLHTGTTDVLPDVYTSATGALRTLLSTGGWRLLVVDERHARKYTMVHVCTAENAPGGRGNCMCCYADVPFFCVLAM